MSDGTAQTIYSIDTNVLMDWQARYFPTDVFKSLVEKMDGLMKVYNRYPVSELIIHPRVRQDFYRNHADLEAFDRAFAQSRSDGRKPCAVGFDPAR